MQRDLKEQLRYQEMELILSSDFDKMSLEELNEASAQYINLQKQGETLHWSTEQYKAWQTRNRAFARARSAAARPHRRTARPRAAVATGSTRPRRAGKNIGMSTRSQKT